MAEKKSSSIRRHYLASFDNRRELDRPHNGFVFAIFLVAGPLPNAVDLPFFA
jgi:hypothetical protein